MTTKRETALQLLIEEREAIDRAITALQDIGVSAPRKRGRPPNSQRIAIAPTHELPTKDGRRRVSAAGRRKMAEAQKRRWAKVKAAAKGKARSAGA